MGLLDRALKNGIRNAVDAAVEKSVRSVVQPAVDRTAAKAVNSAASKLNDAATERQAQYNSQQAQTVGSENAAAAQNLETAFSAYSGVFQNMANSAAKNMKVCPSCGETATADKKFCPSCGTKLPDTTVAESSVCPQCGKQNDVGVKFCSDCGAKLPCMIAEEAGMKAKDDAVLEQWKRYLPQYPLWNLGGTEYYLDVSSVDYYSFSVRFPSPFAANEAVMQYREVLKQNGFRTAGQYPSESHLYKRIDGVCYDADTEHCFDGDSNCPYFNFTISDPPGGFDYVKPAPRQSGSIFDLFK